MLNTYRGAEIFEVNPLDESEAQILGCKVIAEGRLPEPKNMKVDFMEEAENQKRALKGIKKKIDRYLDKHRIREFVLEDHDQ